VVFGVPERPSAFLARVGELVVGDGFGEFRVGVGGSRPPSRWRWCPRLPANHSR
jgi:hypothetical protein